MIPFFLLQDPEFLNPAAAIAFLPFAKNLSV